MMRPKILIAEDEPSRARFFQTSLESAGFQIFQATDSARAWRIIRTQDLVMALIDTNLPGLRNCNLLLCVRADPSLSKLSVVLLGGSASSEEVAEWLNLGADDYISRSISSELLKAEVHAKLRRGKWWGHN